MSRIEELYYGFVNSNEYSDSKSVLDAYSKIEEVVENEIKDKDTANKIMDLCVSHAGENERQGFVYGFKFAMCLMRECNL